MADYRCFPIAPSGSIDGPGRIVDAEDDTSAIVKAREILPEQPFEVWQGARRVCYEPSIRRPLAGIG